MKRINDISSYQDYKKAKFKNTLFVLLIQITILISFFIAWELSARFGLINEFLISKPSAIIKLFVEYISSNNLLRHIYISLLETLLGLIIGTIIGFIIATILYLFPVLSKILDPYLVVLNALPKTALAPILIIWAGTNIKGIVVVSISLSLVITIISALSYFNSVDSNLIKMMQVYNASKLKILTKIIYPSNIINIFSIIKVNIGLSWVGVIVAEFLVSKEGIGYLVVYGGQVFRLDLVMMGVIVLCLIALIMYKIVNIIEYIFTNRK